jgi:homopolymeric O-antigen transport system ATP-binding protein
MADPGIVFEHVWKKFRKGELHDSLRDLIPALVRRVIKGRPSGEDASTGEFWALQDVSFEVRPGDALGVIGPNGAGKSTILKVVTGILRPNRGQCELRGRVGALIEIAAGFHGDLTGKENIFLQGAIMGMPDALIRKRFDEIVAFSEIQEFLDTPVKRYSSGMNARLGFAVAAHLDPDVLIVDEVLAVGDRGFQAKAFERIRQMATSGIPVLVVSHQLDRIAELCNAAILLDRGRVVHQGSPAECIRRYMEPRAGEGASYDGDAFGTLDLPDGNCVRSGERLRVVVELRAGAYAPASDSIETLAVRVRDSRSNRIVAAVSASMCGVVLREGGPMSVDASLQMNVPAGVYSLETVVWDRKRGVPLARGPSAAVFVEEGPAFLGQVQLNARMELLEPGA